MTTAGECGTVLPGTDLTCDLGDHGGDGRHRVTLMWPDGHAGPVEWWDVIPGRYAEVERSALVAESGREGWCPWCERPTLFVGDGCTRCGQSFVGY